MIFGGPALVLVRSGGSYVSGLLLASDGAATVPAQGLGSPLWGIVVGLPSMTCVDRWLING
ncbi:hypothetical protein DP939_00710 [Spongiactinospora rosea]|uniref:Uncharacterized protein n=1 Tax=Spongiactinospora rosea TaxID=2248750 RepID=A0A366M6C3_9ACTN|nr:hypothetical protein DP939_00710 [Spongiactinospora rosea]